MDPPGHDHDADALAVLRMIAATRDVFTGEHSVTREVVAVAQVAGMRPRLDSQRPSDGRYSVRLGAPGEGVSGVIHISAETGMIIRAILAGKDGPGRRYVGSQAVRDAIMASIRDNPAAGLKARRSVANPLEFPRANPLDAGPPSAAGVQRPSTRRAVGPRRLSPPRPRNG
jgi:hypothetical protein